jgi:hypothetical protein
MARVKRELTKFGGGVEAAGCRERAREKGPRKSMFVCLVLPRVSLALSRPASPCAHPSPVTENLPPLLKSPLSSARLLTSFMLGLVRSSLRDATLVPRLRSSKATTNPTKPSSTLQSISRRYTSPSIRVQHSESKNVIDQLVSRGLITAMTRYA